MAQTLRISKGDYAVNTAANANIALSTNYLTVTGNVVALGGIQATAIGNVTVGTGAFSTLSATSTFSLTATTQTISATSQTTGTLTLGGTAQTGTQTFGQSASNHTANFGSGTTSSNNTKLVYLGANGAAGSNTTITVGPTLGYGIATFATNTNVRIANTAKSTSTTTGALTISGGLGVVGNIYTAGNLILSSNSFIGVGTSTPDSDFTLLAYPQTVSYSLSGNSTTAGTDIHVAGADSSISRIVQDSFGTGTYVAFTGRSARGTAASPTQSQSGDVLVQYTARGFSNGNLQFGNSSTGIVSFEAAENFTDTSRATKVVIQTTPSGSITPVAAATFEANGTTTFGSNVKINGNLTVTNVSYINQETITTSDVIQGNLTANALSVNNSTTIGSTLGVTGAGIIYGGLQLTPIGNVNGQASTGSFTTITANSNVTAFALSVNNSVVINTTLGVVGNAILGNLSTTFVNGNASPGSTSTTSNAVGYLGMPQNSQSANYILALIDQGKHVYVTANSNVTIPANSSVSFPIGTTISIINAANVQSNVLITTDTLYLAANGATGTRNISTYGMATLVKVTNTVWYINGSGVS